MRLDIADELDKKLNLFSELFGEKRSQRRLALQCNIPHGRSEDFIEMGAYLRFPVWYSSLTVPSGLFQLGPGEWLVTRALCEATEDEYDAMKDVPVMMAPLA